MTLAPAAPRLVAASAFLAGALALLATVPPAHAQEPAPVLKPEVEVHGELVTLGDLFHNAGAAADVAVFRAPDLGMQGVVAARRVAAAAERHGLIWTAPAGIEHVTVRRPSRLVSVEEVAALIRSRLAADLGATDAEMITVDLDYNAKPIHVDPRISEPLVVKRLDYDGRSGMVRAIVGLQEARRDTPDRRYQGRAQETVAVPVPVRTIERGMTIAESDIAMERIAKTLLPGDALGEPAAIVGMAAKRRLTPGRAIRRFDLERARLVQRDGHVVIIYAAPGLLLKTMGRALSDGAEGDSIAVLNLQSKRTIFAEVTGPGEVRVSAGARPALAERARPARAASGSRHIVR